MAPLWRAMQYVGIQLRPRVKAIRYKRPNQAAEWIVSVKILIPDDRYGTHRQAHYHHDGVLRRTLEAGVSEVARIALSTMCYTYREEL